jgi:hypothetical protein
MSGASSRRAPAGEAELDRMLTAAELAELCGRSVRWVHSLREAGHLKSEGGRYRLGPALAGVVEHFHKRAEGGKPDVRVNLARAREIELRTAMRRAELISIDDVVEVLAGMVDLAEGEFRDLGDRAFPNDPDRREALGRMVADIFERVRDQRDALEAGLRGNVWPDENDEGAAGAAG